MKRSWRRLTLCAAALLFVAGCAPLPAPPAASGPPAAAAPATPAPETGVAAPAETAPSEAATVPLPGVLEVVPRALVVEQEALEVAQRLAALESSGGSEPELGEAEARLLALRQRLHALRAQARPTGDAILELRRQAGLENAFLAELAADLGSRAEALAELDRRWRERQEFWSLWRRALTSDPAYVSVEARLIGTNRLIEETVRRIERSVPAVVEVQQEARDLVLEAREISAEVRLERMAWRRDLERRTAPPLWSEEYRRSLAESVWRPGTVPPGRPLRPDDVWLAVLALALGVGATLGLRRFETWTAADDPSRRLVAHPWGVGLFVAIAVYATFRSRADGLLELAVTLLLAFSLGQLAASVQPGWHRRLAIYALALALVGRSVAGAFALPVATERLVLVIFAACLLPILFLVVRRDLARHGGRRTPFVAAVRVAAAGLVCLAVAEVAGYHALAQWLLDALLGTLTVWFLGSFVLELGRSLLRLGLAAPAARRLEWLSALAPELERRGGRLLKGVLVLFALLALADFWDVTESPLEGWQRLIGLRFEIAGSAFTVGRLLLSLGALYLGLLAAWLLPALLERRVGTRPGLDRGAQDSIRTLLRYALVTAAFLLALGLAGIDLRNLTILAGALGVGIGFGLQNIVNNFVSGMILLFERPVRPGDTVAVAGETGVVQRIGLRSTIVQTYDRSEVIVPNSQLIAEKVTNWTLTNRVARMVIPVGVAYGSDLVRVREVLGEIARQDPRVLADPEPFAAPVAFGDNAIQLELRVWVADADDRPRVLGELIETIASRFEREGIEIPFPQTDVHLRQGPLPKAEEPA